MVFQRSFEDVAPWGWKMEQAGGDPGSLELYEYPESAGARFVPSWSEWEDAPNASESPGKCGHTGADHEKPGSAEFERRLAEERRHAFEAGRTRGMEEGREAEREAFASAQSSAEEKRIGKVAELLQEFESQRNRYFQAVEERVVKLALAVAARILRRESQTDPLLLMGAVRVALGQLSSSTEVRLRVPPAAVDLWTEAIALLPKPGAKPLVLAGEGMHVGECVIETAMGHADLGIPGQLAEMERSLLEPRARKEEQDSDASGTARAVPLEVPR